MRKSKAKFFLTCFIITFLILIASIAIIVIGKKMMDEYQLQISEMQYEMDANKQVVYVASDYILAGMTIEEDVNVYKQQIYTGLGADSYISESDLGSTAIIDIPYGEPVMKSAVTPLMIAKDSREYEISVAALMTDQQQYQYVDVRIMFPNGEDYIVLSKKPVLSLKLQNSVFYTYLNEDEILRLASATIDAYTISGTRIYTTRYIEQNLQDEAIPTYVVSPETLDLIHNDPNISSIAVETMSLQARMDLENRLRGLTEDQLKAVTSGHSLTDTAKNAVLLDDTYSSQSGTYSDDELDGYYTETTTTTTTTKGTNTGSLPATGTVTADESEQTETADVIE